ncbi:MAG: hypothetical protein A3B68_09370 [Candidatus Melainabacteria bacterium RIFCSPHIGHO2_02_FULL_34_12]|nr:MAG: hypothetical protein A3B68_09370 [Candidatus Melainabacteria bacterium RIFCSPHIGHO2_02_FULL_34_12]
MVKRQSVSKSQFWEEKYIQGNTPWDIGSTAPAFVKYFSNILKKYPYADIPTQRVAVLGCGRGHDAFYFAKNKKLQFDVYGFDFSKGAIKYCNEIKEKNKIKNIQFIQKDFFKLIDEQKWKSKFDYVIEHTSFCAINPKGRKKYIQLLKNVLKPGGKVVGLFFMRPKEMGGPPYGIEPALLRELFNKDFTEINKLHPVKCLHGEKLSGKEWFGIFAKKHKNG